MGKLERMAAGLGSFCSLVEESTAEVIRFYRGDMEERVRQQLLGGTGADGQPLHPTYLEDGFFKDAKSANAYVAWKSHASIQSVPANGSPNLFINGTFHRSLAFDDCDGGMTITSDFHDAPAIFQKWGKENFVPDEEFLDAQIKPVVKDRLVTILKSKLFL